MTAKQHIIVVDPTAFSGGSKVATESILRLVEATNIKITVLSADKSSWQGDRFTRIPLYEPRWLAQQEQGIPYFLRHAFIALNLFVARLRFGSFDLAIGASGPGVDLSLYLLRPLLKFNIIQLIHGPVAKSRTIARCLKVASQVFYLQSSIDSLKAVLSTLSPETDTLPDNFFLLKNGLSKERWPSACQTEKHSVFWAASLLKWKGLDTLLSALQQMPETDRLKTEICYIRPQGVQLPVTEAPVLMMHVDWYENPTNLDEVRASANIFVSTSQNEPFGLSILEAMAAGQCVLIPRDGAYWDKILTDNVDCIKYQPDDVSDLKEKLDMLGKDMSLIIKIGAQAANIALGYRAEKQYENVVNSIEQAIAKPASSGSQHGQD